jgi:hypothetical protein
MSTGHLPARHDSERQYCEMCRDKEKGGPDYAVPRSPYFKLGHKLIQDDHTWGPIVAMKFAEIHRYRGVGLTPEAPRRRIADMIQGEIAGRWEQARTTLKFSDEGNLLANEAIERFLHVLDLRTQHAVAKLEDTSTFWHADSLFEVEPDEIIGWQEGEHKAVILLNPELGKSRRTCVLDPLENLARWTFYSHVAQYATDVRALLEGKWLLQSYFEGMGWSRDIDTVNLAVKRYWYWLDLQYMLFLYFWIGCYKEDEGPRRVERYVRMLQTLEVITETPHKVPAAICKTPALPCRDDR